MSASGSSEVSKALWSTRLKRVCYWHNLDCGDGLSLIYAFLNHNDGTKKHDRFLFSKLRGRAPPETASTMATGDTNGIMMNGNGVKSDTSREECLRVQLSTWKKTIKETVANRRSTS